MKWVAVTVTVLLSCVGVIAHAMWHEWQRISNDPIPFDDGDDNDYR